MQKPMTEQIFRRHSDAESITPGEIIFARVDCVLATDGTAVGALCIARESGKLHMDGRDIFEAVLRAERPLCTKRTRARAPAFSKRHRTSDSRVSSPFSAKWKNWL